MTRTGDVKHVQVTCPDQAVEMRVDEVQARGRTPVTEKPRLDVLEPKGLTQERIVQKIDLPYRQIVGSPPIAVDQIKLARVERVSDGARLCHRRDLSVA